MFNFSTIKEIWGLPDNARIDFIGVVISIGDLDEINLKSGRVKPVWRIVIADNSEEKGISIQVAFWGEICKKLNFPKGTVLAMKAIKVGVYNGKSLNVSEENIFTSDYKGWERDLLERWA